MRTLQGRKEDTDNEGRITSSVPSTYQMVDFGYTGPIPAHNLCVKTLKQFENMFRHVLENIK